MLRCLVRCSFPGFADVRRRNAMQGIAHVGDGGSEMQTGEGEVTQTNFSRKPLMSLSWSVSRKWPCFLSQGLGSLGRSLSQMQPLLEMLSEARARGRISLAFPFPPPALSLQSAGKRPLLAVQSRGHG